MIWSTFGRKWAALPSASAAISALSANLASWAGVTRASGFDTFVATPSSANFAALLTNETGTAGTVPFESSGSFTPTLSFGGGSTGITYTTQTGSYVRIGNLVLFQAFIQLSSKGSSTGGALISGLPFTIGTSFGGAPQFYSNMSGLTGPLGLNNQQSTTTTQVIQFTTTGSPQIADTNFTNTSFIVLCGFYKI